MLTGIYTPTSGIVRMDGEVMNGKKAYQFTRKGIARTFQNIRLFGAASVLENLTIAMEADTHYTLADTLLRTPRFRK